MSMRHRTRASERPAAKHKRGALPPRSAHSLEFRSLALAARYALICQSEGIVPIVEPDLVLAGSHTLEDAIEINVRVLNCLFGAMAEHGCHLEGCILKVNMVNAGKDCHISYTADQIADANLRTLRRTLPVAVRTVNYLSGGQPLAEACARLDAINRLKAKRGGDRYAPWNLSYSWSAAVQVRGLPTHHHPHGH